MHTITATRVKANSHYTCQECGATELIQAHHMIPGDDTSLVCLCADCHSKKHPSMPKTLFYSIWQQTYWYNKSASSIAKKLKVCSRTVIRAARRLHIGRGDLSQYDEDLLTSNLFKTPKTKEPKEPFRPVTRICPRCSCQWQSKNNKAFEATCPRCKQWIALNNPIAAKIRRERAVSLFPANILVRLAKEVKEE